MAESATQITPTQISMIIWKGFISGEMKQPVPPPENKLPRSGPIIVLGGPVYRSLRNRKPKGVTPQPDSDSSNPKAAGAKVNMSDSNSSSSGSDDAGKSNDTSPTKQERRRTNLVNAAKRRQRQLAQLDEAMQSHEEYMKKLGPQFTKCLYKIELTPQEDPEKMREIQQQREILLAKLHTMLRQRNLPTSFFLEKSQLVNFVREGKLDVNLFDFSITLNHNGTCEISSGDSAPRDVSGGSGDPAPHDVSGGSGDSAPHDVSGGSGDPAPHDVSGSSGDPAPRDVSDSSGNKIVTLSPETKRTIYADYHLVKIDMATMKWSLDSKGFAAMCKEIFAVQQEQLALCEAWDSLLKKSDDETHILPVFCTELAFENILRGNPTFLRCMGPELDLYVVPKRKMWTLAGESLSEIGDEFTCNITGLTSVFVKTLFLNTKTFAMDFSPPDSPNSDIPSYFPTVPAIDIPSLVQVLNEILKNVADEKVAPSNLRKMLKSKDFIPENTFRPFSGVPSAPTPVFMSDFGLLSVLDISQSMGLESLNDIQPCKTQFLEWLRRMRITLNLNPVIPNPIRDLRNNLHPDLNSFGITSAIYSLLNDVFDYIKGVSPYTKMFIAPFSLRAPSSHCIVIENVQAANAFLDNLISGTWLSNLRTETGMTCVSLSEEVHEFTKSMPVEVKLVTDGGINDNPQSSEQEIKNLMTQVKRSKTKFSLIFIAPDDAPRDSNSQNFKLIQSVLSAGGHKMEDCLEFYIVPFGLRTLNQDKLQMTLTPSPNSTPVDTQASVTTAMNIPAKPSKVSDSNAGRVDATFSKTVTVQCKGISYDLTPYGLPELVILLTQTKFELWKFFKLLCDYISQRLVTSDIIPKILDYVLNRFQKPEEHMGFPKDCVDNYGNLPQGFFNATTTEEMLSILEELRAAHQKSKEAILIEGPKTVGDAPKPDVTFKAGTTAKARMSMSQGSSIYVRDLWRLASGSLKAKPLQSNRVKIISSDGRITIDMDVLQNTMQAIPWCVDAGRFLTGKSYSVSVDFPGLGPEVNWRTCLSHFVLPGTDAEYKALLEALNTMMVVGAGSPMDVVMRLFTQLPIRNHVPAIDKKTGTPVPLPAGTISPLIPIFAASAKKSAWDVDKREIISQENLPPADPSNMTFVFHRLSDTEMTVSLVRNGQTLATTLLQTTRTTMILFAIEMKALRVELKGDPQIMPYMNPDTVVINGNFTSPQEAAQPPESTNVVLEHPSFSKESQRRNVPYVMSDIPHTPVTLTKIQFSQEKGFQFVPTRGNYNCPGLEDITDEALISSLPKDLNSTMHKLRDIAARCLLLGDPTAKEWFKNQKIFATIMQLLTIECMIPMHDLIFYMKALRGEAVKQTPELSDINTIHKKLMDYLLRVRDPSTYVSIEISQFVVMNDPRLAQYHNTQENLNIVFDPKSWLSFLHRKLTFREEDEKTDFEAVLLLCASMKTMYELQKVVKSYIDILDIIPSFGDLYTLRFLNFSDAQGFFAKLHALLEKFITDDVTSMQRITNMFSVMKRDVSEFEEGQSKFVDKIRISMKACQFKLVPVSSVLGSQLSIIAVNWNSSKNAPFTQEDLNMTQNPCPQYSPSGSMLMSPFGLCGSLRTLIEKDVISIGEGHKVAQHTRTLDAVTIHWVQGDAVGNKTNHQKDGDRTLIHIGAVDHIAKYYEVIEVLKDILGKIKNPQSRRTFMKNCMRMLIAFCENGVFEKSPFEFSIRECVWCVLVSNTNVIQAKLPNYTSLLEYYEHTCIACTSSFHRRERIMSKAISWPDEAHALMCEECMTFLKSDDVPHATFEKANLTALFRSPNSRKLTTKQNLLQERERRSTPGTEPYKKLYEVLKEMEAAQMLISGAQPDPRIPFSLITGKPVEEAS